MSRDLAQLGHNYQDIAPLRDAIAIQERVVESITDHAAAADVLAHVLHTYSHLAEELKTRGQLDEARRVCATYWQTVDRRDALMPDDAQNNWDAGRPLCEPLPHLDRSG